LSKAIFIAPSAVATEFKIDICSRAIRSKYEMLFSLKINSVFLFPDR
jgi:hypothetical protein